MTSNEDVLQELFPIIEEYIFLLEKWSNSSGVTPKSYEKNKVASKVINMSPDEYIKRGTRLTGYGYNKARKNLVKQAEEDRSSHREGIEKCKKEISDPNQEVKLPFLKYNKGEQGQEGLHRAVAAKELGHKTIPVEIIYGTDKDGNENRGDKKKARAQIAANKAEQIVAEKKRQQEEKERQGQLAQIEKDKKAHPEKYNKKSGQVDLSPIFGPGW